VPVLSEGVVMQDLTTYTESDALGRLSETAARVTWTNLQVTDDQIYLYKDFGVGYFGTNFTVDFTFDQTASTQNASYVYFMGFANALNDWAVLITGTDLFGLEVIHQNIPNRVQLWIRGRANNGSFSDDGSIGYTITDGTVYYMRLVRDNSVGTYGTVYLYIYSDAAHTTLLSTLTATLPDTMASFRYLLPVMSYDGSSSTDTCSGYVENINFPSLVNQIFPMI